MMSHSRTGSWRSPGEELLHVAEVDLPRGSRGSRLGLIDSRQKLKHGGDCGAAPEEADSSLADAVCNECRESLFAIDGDSMYVQTSLDNESSWSFESDPVSEFSDLTDSSVCFHCGDEGCGPGLVCDECRESLFVACDRQGPVVKSTCKDSNAHLSALFVPTTNDDFESSAVPSLGGATCFHCGVAGVRIVRPSNNSVEMTTSVNERINSVCKLGYQTFALATYHEPGIFHNIVSFLLPEELCQLGATSKGIRTLLWGHALDLRENQSKRWFTLNEIDRFFVSRQVRRMWRVRSLALRCMGPQCADDAVRLLGRDRALQSLKLSMDFSRLNLSHKSLLHLDLSYCRNLEDISALRQCGPGLRSLSLEGCERVEGISILSSCSELETLSLEGCRNVRSIQVLANCPKLHELNLSLCYSLFLSPNATLAAEAKLPPLPKLRKLSFRGCTQLVALPALAEGAMGALESLDISCCDQLVDLSQLSVTYGGSLQRLDASFCEGLVNIGPLKSCQRLRWLNLGHCYNLSDAMPLGDCVHLVSANLSSCIKLHEAPLGRCLALEKLSMAGCSGLRQVSGLSTCARLRELDLSFCSSLTSISGLGKLQQLEGLNLNRCGKLHSIATLLDCPKLKSVDIKWCNFEASELRSRASALANAIRSW